VALAEETTKGFQKLASDKKIGIKKEFPDSTVIVSVDTDKLTQVLINLIGNAIKFTNKGDIVIRIIDLQDEVQVEIQDTGPGMAKDEIPKIFDKFVRVVSEKKEGTGLGLPIAKDIVELHNGRIRVESDPGKGSNFIFNLPKKRGS
jgi:signal transduction histidine kinase